MRIGRNIRAVRRRRGLTLDGLSALCGVSRDDLGRYERGQMTPRPGTVEKIAAALEVPLEFIQGGVGWTAQQPMERWEAGDGAPLRDGILEAVREARGEAFTPEEADLQLLMASVKAAIPALVERLKDTRPEADIRRDILADLGLQPPRDGADYVLTDEQWEQISPLLPPERAGRGRTLKSNRLMLEGILYHMRSGTAWKDLPERFGRHKCVSDRLRRWRQQGVWDAVEETLRALGAL